MPYYVDSPITYNRDDDFVKANAIAYVAFCEPGYNGRRCLIGPYWYCLAVCIAWNAARGYNQSEAAWANLSALVTFK
jgi:tryptophan-rich sensory protein